MNEVLNADITPEQAAQLKALMEQCIEAIDAANERMDGYEADRERLRVETHVIFQRLRKKLDVENDSQLSH